MSPVMPGPVPFNPLDRDALAAPETVTQPALLWSNQALRGGELNTIVLWSPGLGLEPKIRVKPSAGKVEEVVASGDRITVTYQAPESSAPGRVHFQIKGKGEAGPVAGAVELLLEASQLPPIQIELDPPVFNFGDAGVRVKLTPPHSMLDDGSRNLQINTTLGTISEPMSAGDGSWVTRWEPPAQMDGSAVVLITASEPGHPDGVLGWSLLPVQVKRELPFQVEPNSQNILRVGTREWGPIQADSSGIVRFNVALDPRIVQGDLQSVAEGLNETRTVDLFWESPDVFAMIPAPAAAAADPTHPLGVHMLIFGPEGSPREGATPELISDHGILGDIHEQSPGTYRAELIPPADAQSGRLEMRLGGQSTGQDLRFVLPAGRTSIQLDPSGLSADQNRTDALVYLHDPAESVRTGQIASLHASGGSPEGKAKLQKNGSTTLGLTLSETTFDTLAVAWPSSGEATSLPPARLLAWAPGAALPADGTTSTPLVVVAVDRFGQGVSGVPLDFRIGTGGGWVTPSATTDASGVAVVDYRAGRSFGPAQILVRGKGLQQAAMVYQHDGMTDPPLAPPPTALEQAWMKRIASSRLSRQRPAGISAPEIGPLAIPEPVVRTPTTATGPTTSVPTATDTTTTSTDTSTDTTSSTTTAPLVTKESSAGKGLSLGNLNLGAGLLVLGHTYDATSDALNYAPTASFEHTVPGAPGLDLRARMGITEEIDLDLRGRVFTERMGAGDSVPWNFEWGVLAGAAYGQDLTSWFSWKGTGHIHRQALGAFTYSNAARTEFEMKALDNWGLRLGAGIQFTVLDGFLEIEAAETFGLRPVDHYLGMTAGWAIDERLTGTLGFDMDTRNMRSTLETGTLEISDQVKGLRLGIQTSL
jgi:hypothetical protein